MHLNTDTRITEILQWLPSTPLKLVADSLRIASADASFRRYFRIDDEQGKSYIIMDAPPAHEDTSPFIFVNRLFQKAEIKIPELLSINQTQGFLLLTDFGDTTYLKQLDEKNADTLYRCALNALVKLQATSEENQLPNYDRDLLLRELMLFSDWYIKVHLAYTLSDEQQAQLQQVFEKILANNLAQAPVYVHRDYHSRNLMYLEQDPTNPGIIDFQDAVYGPATYDVVSLLRDAYIGWDEEQVLDWAIRYWQAAKKQHIPVAADIDQFYRDFEWMGLQRHLKVLGIFARLYHRDGKAAYLENMPQVFAYVRATASRYREFNSLLHLLDELQQSKPQVSYTF